MDKNTVHAYINTLLWSETLGTYDEGGTLWVIDGQEYPEDSNFEDLVFEDTPGYADLFKQATEDLEGFQAYCRETIGLDPFRFFDPEQVAHDFCLSRNDHGAGFFDDPYDLAMKGPNGWTGFESLSDELQDAAKTFGTHGLMAYRNSENDFAIESHG